MKQIIITGIFVLGSFCHTLKADPLSDADSIEVFTATQWLTLYQPTENKTQVYMAGGNFWGKVLKAVLWITKPIRPVWGRYEEDNNKKIAPYTTFLNANNNLARNSIRENIRNKTKGYDLIYSELYLSVSNDINNTSWSQVLTYLLDLSYSKAASLHFVKLICYKCQNYLHSYL